MKDVLLQTGIGFIAVLAIIAIIGENPKKTVKMTSGFFLAIFSGYGLGAFAAYLARLL